MKNDNNTPATNWYTKPKTKIKLAIISCTLVFNLANAQTTYWVTKGGNDDNNCTNATDDACLTIQKGISMATQPGDIVNIGTGTYIENTDTSPYTTKAGWLDGDYGSLGLDYSGELGNPITIQAIPGHEGGVIIDSEMARLGLVTRNNDYVHIKGLTFINNYIIGIASWGQTENEVADESLLAIGIVVENNYIYNTAGPQGKNVSAVGMWGSKDWIVRNNKLEKIYSNDNPARSQAGIQAYGVINALIEHNDISDTGNGIYWKYHFIADLTTRNLVFESEIRYNKIEAREKSVFIGSNAVEAGDNYIHHNILFGHDSNEAAGVGVRTIGALGQSGDVRIEHNLIDGEGNIQARGIYVNASRNITVKGNIIIRSKTNAEYSATDTYVALGKKPVLNVSDYNIYNNFQYTITADANGSTVQDFSTLPPWQAALNSQFVSLNFDNPDTNSITATPENLFDNLDDKNYIYKADSPAIGFMPDNSNAGPYQFGNEIIGLLSQWPGTSLTDLIFTNGFE